MSVAWATRVTVATVVREGDRYLLVEERDKRSGALVFNQPAGHLEPGESLQQAALRETLEETAWEVALRGVLGVSLFTPPGAPFTYLRLSFVADPVRQDPERVLDPDIHAVHWLDYAAVRAASARLRSPLVLAAIERERSGLVLPLDALF